ncbi:hypothetical protein BDR04DRAFT_1093841 [Suillus decipiens]|nr:hypothetical protein BDR04DRAFT_1093841 [Suillus decipiens]
MLVGDICPRSHEHGIKNHVLPDNGTRAWHHQRRLRSSMDKITHCLRAGHGADMGVAPLASPMKLQRRDHAQRDMGVAPSASPKKLQRRNHALPENGTGEWHHQCRPRSSKDEITYFLRAEHWRGAISVA